MGQKKQKGTGLFCFRKEFIKYGRTRAENFKAYERKGLCADEGQRDCYDYESTKKRI